jgi:hypothetical protein
VLRTLRDLGLCLCVVLSLTDRPAQAIEPPHGPVVLTISGAISQANTAAGLAFDQAMLDSLPQTEVATETPWTQGMITFSGVSLKALLDFAGAKGTTISAVALNDYSVDIPVTDAANPSVIVAARKNGALMPVRDKGPLWIIYPLSDDDTGAAADATHSKMIWQLKQMVIK